MLVQLIIKNFAIINDLDISFKPGMTVFTGETGAGKSIMIDALLLALGGRAESSVIQPNKERCVISAAFETKNFPPACEWLKQHELDENDECILRRVISNDGRSKAFINSQNVPLQLLRELGSILINIHGQHEHQQLLKAEKQRHLLDAYANHPSLLTDLEKVFSEWQNTQQKIQLLETKLNQQQAKNELLRYQIEELDKLELGENEYSELDQEQRQLAHAEQLISSSQNICNILANDDNTNISHLLNYCSTQLTSLIKIDASLAEINELIVNAELQISEAARSLENYLANTELNPQRLQWVENRLSQIMTFARKHHTQAEKLAQVHEQLKAEINSADEDQKQLAHFKQIVATLEKQYLELATRLTKSRQQAAKKLAKQVENRLQNLAMPNSQFAIQITPLEDLTWHGQDKIEFQASTNPGQPLQNLSKVVSGGELSRISLALHVLTAESEVKPTLIFDEVDTGIGGATAEVVGRLLQELSQSVQLLCVTHLPQVAALAKNHLRVNKIIEKNQTLTSVETLSNEEKIQEIARMLGGVKITKQTLAHAKEMLTQ